MQSACGLYLLDMNSDGGIAKDSVPFFSFFFKQDLDFMKDS